VLRGMLLIGIEKRKVWITTSSPCTEQQTDAHLLAWLVLLADLPGHLASNVCDLPAQVHFAPCRSASGATVAVAVQGQGVVHVIEPCGHVEAGDRESRG